MHAHSNYKIEINGTNDELEAIADILADAFEGDEFFSLDKYDVMIDGVVNVRETYKVVFLEDITDLAMKMAKAATGSSFTIKGVVDTSESAGEYMNFLISYAQRNLEERSSYWYMYPDGCVENMTYEEFCENYGDEYSEDDFEKMQKGWFIVETSRTGITMMPTVPLDQVRTISI